MVLKLLLLFLFSFYLPIKYSYINAKTNFNTKLSKEIKIDLPKYLIGPGDVIKVAVYKFDSFASTVKIMPDGTINLPRINSINVNNLSIDEANKLITNRYKEIIRNPIVYIDLIKSRPVTININGEVERPGIYTLNTEQNNGLVNLDNSNQLVNNIGWPTIIEAIQKAGGLTLNADLRRIKLRRYNKEKDSLDEININFWDKLVKGGFIQNYEIFDGDNIYIESSSISKQEEKNFISSTNLAKSFINVTVIGQVKNPGQIKLKANSPVKQAVLNAGGFTRKSNQKKLTLLRLKNNGKIEKNIISDDSLLLNKNFLKENDVVFVDENSLSKTTNNLKDLVEPIRPILDAATLYKILFD